MKITDKFVSTVRNIALFTGAGILLYAFITLVSQIIKSL
jgi:hypothetical protein